MNRDPFLIEFDRRAQPEVEALAHDIQRRILDAIQTYLSTTPFQPIKTRIKRMEGFMPPLYRLRIGDYRAYYRIKERRVVILGVLHKHDAERWLRQAM